MSLSMDQESFEELYRRLNHRRYVHPDPLEFLHQYRDPADVEVVALVASSLAYGRVGQILRSVQRVLGPMSPGPARYVRDCTPARLRRDYGDFRHRFQTHAELSALLLGMRGAIRRHGSLKKLFASQDEGARGDMTAAMTGLVRGIDPAGRCGHLLPDPSRGSACKRLNLMLRWLVRCDAVDVGGWKDFGPHRLTVPLDTHMHRIAHCLGATRRRSADGATAREVTAAFARLCADDPVRYDFALTRLGINPQPDMHELYAACGLGPIHG